MTTLTLLRHGESVSNRDNQFAGWADVELTERGRKQAEHIAHTLSAHQLAFDISFTSTLRRAIDTLNIVLEKMRLKELPLEMSWHLNERHCGDFEGLRVREAIQRHGFRRMLRWQCCASVSPPPMTPDDARAPGNDPQYAALGGISLPHAESLNDVQARVVPYWKQNIEPQLSRGKHTLVVAHRNTIRAIMKHLDGLSDFGAAWIRIPNGAAILYELDDLQPVRRSLLR